MNINYKQGAVFGGWLAIIFLMNLSIQGSVLAAIIVTSTTGVFAIGGIAIVESL